MWYLTETGATEKTGTGSFEVPAGATKMQLTLTGTMSADAVGTNKSLRLGVRPVGGGAWVDDGGGSSLQIWQATIDTTNGADGSPNTGDPVTTWVGMTLGIAYELVMRKYEFAGPWYSATAGIVWAPTFYTAADVVVPEVFEPWPVGVWVDWDDDGFDTDTASDGSLARLMPEAVGVSDNITSDVIEFGWQRGGTADLAGGATPGSCTILVKNASKKYNPDNASSSLSGKLRPGRPVWIGVNGNGSMVETAGQTVYGVFAGRIREIAPQPLEQVCEIICDDPLASYRRVPVRLADSTTRSQAAYRAAIMTAIGEPAGRLSLPAESAMLPLSSLDKDALAALDELNTATGTRHYVQPSSIRDTWYRYTARDRNYHLGTAADATIDFGSDHVVAIDGYRVTEEAIVNVQKATLSPVSFPLGAATVWTHAQVPLTVTGNVVVWANLEDYVAEATLEVTSTGAAVTSTLTSFGTTAKIELYSAGAQVQSLAIVGKQVIREQSVSLVAEDESSKEAYGSRAGSEIISDLFGSQAEAKGIADHTVWRYAQPLKRPAITLRGAPVATALRELYDVVACTSTALSVSARWFDIVGVSGTWRTATAGVSDFEVTWQLSESRLQTARTFFIIGTSVIDGPDVIGY